MPPGKRRSIVLVQLGEVARASRGGDSTEAYVSRLAPSASKPAKATVVYVCVCVCDHVNVRDVVHPSPCAPRRA